MNNGKIREGDIFKRDGAFILVQGFENEDEDSFAQVKMFDSIGLFVKEDCVNVLALYQMRFIKNISEIA